MSLTAYTVTNSQSWIDRAIFELETSARLNPNYAMSHARLAWAYHLAGRAGEASCAADAALKLDPMHKHEEHKLRQLQVEHLADPPWVSPPQGRTNAEQTMERLRKTSRE
jgi:hypothetical protein